jgi:outer membrane lipoprotein-sorting protein
MICGAAMGSMALLAAPQSQRQATDQPRANPPLPDIHQLIQEVQEHQKQLDKIRESYTFTSMQTRQDIDANGQVKKTETEESEIVFVNGHVIARTVKKNGQPLSDRDQQKETERVTKLVEKAQKTPPGQPSIGVSRVLEIMDVHNERRVNFRGRSTIVFDFVGRKDAKTHGLIEDASKKLQGTIWIDEADGQVARLEVTFIDNFRVAGGLFADIEKGSTFHFDQELVNGELWLPTGIEGTMHARLLLLKNIRRHSIERDYDYKRFNVEAQQLKDAAIAPAKRP